MDPRVGMEHTVIIIPEESKYNKPSFIKNWVDSTLIDRTVHLVQTSLSLPVPPTLHTPVAIKLPELGPLSRLQCMPALTTINRRHGRRLDFSLLAELAPHHLLDFRDFCKTILKFNLYPGSVRDYTLLTLLEDLIKYINPG
jgi:hypothetical protein